MDGLLLVKGAELLLLKTSRGVALVLRGGIISALALCAGQYDYFARHNIKPRREPPRTTDAVRGNCLA